MMCTQPLYNLIHTQKCTQLQSQLHAFKGEILKALNSML